VRPRGVGRSRRKDANACETPAHGAKPIGVHGEPGLVEDLSLLGVGRLDCAGVALERGVRGAEQQHPGPGDGERDTVPVDRDRERRIPAAVALEHEVRASAQRHRRSRPRVLELPDRVDPRPRGVYDDARADLHHLARQGVAHVGDRAAVEPHQLDSVQHDGASVGGAAEIRQTQPRIVGLGVGIEAGGAKAVEPQRRDESRGGRRRDHSAALGDGTRQTRVRPERAADRNSPVRAAPIDRKDEVERPNEVGRHEAVERAHLSLSLADEAEMAETQVAKPAVDELRRRARRSRSEVVALDECDAEPVPRRDLGDSGADDPAADDEQVEPLCPQALECERPLRHA
jgi:hypothetical protein